MYRVDWTIFGYYGNCKLFKTKDGKFTGEWTGSWYIHDDFGNLIISDMSGWHFWIKSQQL